MMAAFILWIPSKAFSLKLNIPKDDADIESVASSTSTMVEWNTIDKHLNALKRLSTHINKVFGTIVILFLLESLLDYGSTIDILILQQNNPDWKLVITNVLYFLHGHCVILFAADICYQVRVLTKI